MTQLSIFDKVVLMEIESPELTKNEPGLGNILILDDWQSDRKALSFILEKIGFSTNEVLTTKTAWSTLNLEKDTATVAIDLNILVLEEFRFLRNLRESAEFSELPVVLLARNFSDLHYEEIEKYMCSYYLIKPLKESKIREVFQEIFPGRLIQDASGI